MLHRDYELPKASQLSWHFGYKDWPAGVPFRALDVPYPALPVAQTVPELVKVAGVAPSELQELGGGSQSQLTT